MRGFIRVAIPLLIAAATPATIAAIGLFEFDPVDAGNLRSAFTLSLNVFAFALIHAVIFGLPAYFLVKHFHLTTWWMSIFCGGAIGTIPGAILDYATNPTFVTHNPQFLRLTFYDGLAGISGGFAAWLTWYLLGRCMAAPRAPA